MSSRYTSDYRQDMRLLKTRPQRVIGLLLVLAAIALPFLLELNWTPPFNLPWRAWYTAVNLALIAVVGAAAFNLLLGYTHQISVAHAAFLMLGTMVAGYLGQVQGWPFWLVLPAAAIAGAIVGAIVGLPALRLRGLYLLIATFGVHYIALLVYRSFQTRFFGFSAIRFDPPTVPQWLHWLPFINAEDGVFAITSQFRWYWVLLPLTVASVLFMVNVIRTREGRAFMAIKEHDVSAALIGINVTRSKLLAFAVSSAFVSMSGVMSAYYLGARSDESFPFHVVLNYAIMIIVGGFSSMQGAVFGAFFFYTAPVLLTWAFTNVPVLSSVDFLRRYEAELDIAIFGVLIIVILVLRPSGLAGIWQSVRGYFARWPYTT